MNRTYLRNRAHYIAGLVFLIAITIFLLLNYVPSETRNSAVGSVLTWARNLSVLVGLALGILNLSDRLRNGNESEPNGNSEPRPVEKFSKTEYELLAEEMDKLQGWFDIVEGDIRLKPSETLGLDRKMMLYTLACWVANKNEDRDTAVVSKQEIMDELGYSDGEVNIFIQDTEEDDFVRVTGYAPETVKIDGEVHEVGDKPNEIEINPRKGKQIVSWIIGEGSSPG